MLDRSFLGVAITATSLLVACGTGTEQQPRGADAPTSGSVATPGELGPIAATSELPCNVQSLLTAHCTSCHAAGSQLAPMAMATRADLLAEAPSGTGRSVAEEALRRMRGDARPMPPTGKITTGEIDGFATWLEGGMSPTHCDDALGPTVLPFEPAAPHAYLAKVKNLLTGLPPTAEELAAVTRDPRQLDALIAGWTQMPEFDTKLLAFFQTAFQQTELTPQSFDDQLKGRLVADGRALQQLLEALSQSFARTALSLVKEHRPFTETLTTDRHALSPALLSFLLLLDERHVSDKLKLTQPQRTFDVRTEGAAVSFAESIDPASAQFMHFTAIGATGTCAVTTRSSKNDLELMSLLLGRTPRATGCNPTATPPLLTDDDFTAFRMVQLRPRIEGEPAPAFYDLPALRRASVVPLSIPRIGFFTTPAFFANWPSNDSNQHRVTANQTLIVALGASFDGKDSTVPISEVGLAAEHAGPATACYACHKTLDPMRMFFRSALTFAYHDQRDAQLADQPGALSFGGLSVQGRGVGALARGLAQHPAFATAWTQRLCYYADAAACAPDDPEFLRIARAFADSGHDFLTLVRQLFASPLVTGSAPTRTFQLRDPLVSVSRQNHLCRALSLRLGITDVCGLQAGNDGKLQKQIRVVAGAIPEDAYSRGSEVPVTLSDTNLFHRGAVDDVCTALAPAVVDNGASSKFRSAALDEALAALVHALMGLAPGDPRAPGALQILREHHRDALATKVSATVALRSTFVLACTSPSTIAIGL